MIAPKIHGLSKECCRAPLRGTIAGYVQHHNFGDNPCPPCMAARNAYLQEQIEAWAAVVPMDRRQEGMKVFAEDYLYLIATGETHPEMIAKRMRTNRRAMERRLYRVGIPLLHQPILRPTERPTQQHRAKVAA